MIDLLWFQRGSNREQKFRVQLKTTSIFSTHLISSFHCMCACVKLSNKLSWDKKYYIVLNVFVNGLDSENDPGVMGIFTQITFCFLFIIIIIFLFIRETEIETNIQTLSFPSAGLNFKSPNSWGWARSSWEMETHSESLDGCQELNHLTHHSRVPGCILSRSWNWKQSWTRSPDTGCRVKQQSPHFGFYHVNSDPSTGFSLSQFTQPWNRC